MRSKRILGFLISAFIASLIYGYLQMPQQERVTSGDDKAMRSQAKKQPQGRQKASVTESVSFPRLRTDLLERTSQPYPGVRRDLFSAAFVTRQEEEAVEILPEEPPEVISSPVVAIVPPPPPSPQVIAQQELTQYKFVGFFKKGVSKTIFLSTAGDVLLVRKGDYLGRDRKYYVVDITDTTLVLRKDGVGDFSILLTEEESLTAIPLQSVPSMAPGTSGRAPQEQESHLPIQPESLPVPVEELPTEDQIHPEEDINETQN